MKTIMSKTVANSKYIILMASVFAIQAQAALPEWATSAVTDVKTTGTDAAAAVGPVFGTILALGFIFKLIKRFMSKV